jgi:photosystem II stability/assembly factor-like uncharacterized protein
MRSLLGTAVLALAMPVALLSPAGAQPARTPAWEQRDTPSTESLRGLDAVDRDTAWVAGDGSGVWRTTDGGSSWQDVAPPDSEGLLFRDVEAVSRDRAVVLSIGNGDASRVYRTDDGGRTWDLSFVNDEEAAFYDCMDFFAGGRRGLVMGDPVDGKFRILATRDGGRSWRVLPDDRMPDATGEFGFAASGTCLETAGARHAWFATGGDRARVFHTRDAGRSWTANDTPIPATPAGGVFSLAFRTVRHGVAVGGDFEAEDNGVDASARTRDGRRWTGGGDLAGYRSGVDWVPGRRATLVAVGPNGADLSTDGGRTWTAFGDTGFHSVVCVSRHTCWASGSGGRVARLRLG